MIEIIGDPVSEAVGLLAEVFQIYSRRSTVIVAGSVCARGSSVRAEVNVGTGAGDADPGIVAVGDTGRLDLVADTLAYGIVLQAIEVTTALVLGVPAMLSEGLRWGDIRRDADELGQRSDQSGL